MVSKLFPSVTVQLNNCSAWSKGACRRPRVTSRWDGKSPKVPKRSAFSHHTSSVGRMFSRFKTWRTTRGAGKPGSRTPAAPIVHSAVSTATSRLLSGGVFGMARVWTVCSRDEKSMWRCRISEVFPVQPEGFCHGNNLHGLGAEVEASVDLHLDVFIQVANSSETCQKRFGTNETYIFHLSTSTFQGVPIKP